MALSAARQAAPFANSTPAASRIKPNRRVAASRKYRPFVGGLANG
jgi:hypothetical protein